MDLILLSLIYFASIDTMDAKKENAWRQRLNPLRWGKVPPIPSEREVTKEYKAGVWKQLTFGWLGEHMNVCTMDRRPYH